MPRITRVGKYKREEPTDLVKELLDKLESERKQLAIQMKTKNNEMVDLGKEVDKLRTRLEMVSNTIPILQERRNA